MSGRIARRAGSDHGDAEVSRGLLPELLGYHLRRAQTAMFKDFGLAVGGAEDITPGLFGMLQVIAANPGMSQSRLAEAMGVDRSTIVTVVDELEARGLVKRTPSLQDGRSHLLCFTGKGRLAVRRMEKLVLRHEASFASVLSAAERETLIGLLARLYERRRGRAPRAGAADRSARRKP
ncbi:MAG: MarR family transcriptional regulator [Anaeromyxobacteraceae bacterium]